MNSTPEKLHEDHRNIAKLLILLDMQAEKLKVGEYSDYQLITDILHYLVNCPNPHHYHHEDLIFNTLKKKRS